MIRDIRFFIAAATLLAPALLVATAPPSTTFGAIVVSHAHRFPAMTVVDLYKLVHQAAFGAEHAIPDSATAAQWLEREWRDMGDGPKEQVFDTIAPGGNLVRLNLRAWKLAGGDRDVVLRAFIATGATTRRDTTTFAAYWNTLVTQARNGAIPFSADQLTEYGTVMQRRGYPAVSHSPEYRAAHRPAYRVIAPALMR